MRSTGKASGTQHIRIYCLRQQTRGIVHRKGVADFMPEASSRTARSAAFRKRGEGDCLASQRNRDQRIANHRAEQSTIPDRQIPAGGADPGTGDASRSQVVKLTQSLLKGPLPTRTRHWNILSSTPNAQAVPLGKRASQRSGCAATEAFRTVCGKQPSFVKRLLRQPRFFVRCKDGANLLRSACVQSET